VNPQHGLTHTVPAPLIVRGTSTNYGADGQIIQQWVKTRLGDKQVETLINALVSELGDVLWYLAQFASELDIYLSDIAEDNITKLKDRQQRNVLGGNGDNR